MISTAKFSADLGVLGEHDITATFNYMPEIREGNRTFAAQFELESVELFNAEIIEFLDEAALDRIIEQIKTLEP